MIGYGIPFSIRCHCNTSSSVNVVLMYFPEKLNKSHRDFLIAHFGWPFSCRLFCLLWQWYWVPVLPHLIGRGQLIKEGICS